VSAERALGAIAAVALPAAFALVAVLSLTSSSDAGPEPPVPAAASAGRAALTRLLAPQMILATPVAVNRAGEPTTVDYAPIPNNPNGTTTPRPPRPARLVIDDIGIDTSLQPVRGTPLGIEVPPLDSAGWYSEGPRPGEPGRTVLIGHRDTEAAPAVFARLPEIEPGTPIEVTDDAGKVHRFTATRAVSIPKDTYPAEAVYAPTPGSELVLITCGGGFAAGHYENSILVFAVPERTA
jgi:sortase family protein